MTSDTLVLVDAGEDPGAPAWQDMHRPRFPFVVPGGWLSDPNGIGHWKGTYTLFYQDNPTQPVRDRIHWGHATSPGLVNWTDEPIALAPREGMNSYTTMPFGSAAKITVTNEHPVHIGGLFFQVYDNLITSPNHQKAAFTPRGDARTPPVLGWTTPWWTASAAAAPISAPSSASPRSSGTGGAKANRSPTSTKKTCGATMQQIEQGGSCLFERGDDVSSVSYSYQIPRHAPFPALPNRDERRPR